MLVDLNPMPCFSSDPSSSEVEVHSVDPKDGKPVEVYIVLRQTKPDVKYRLTTSEKFDVLSPEVGCLCDMKVY